MAKEAILSARTNNEFLALVDSAADQAGMKRGTFILDALDAAIQRRNTGESGKVQKPDTQMSAFFSLNNRTKKAHQVLAAIRERHAYGATLFELVSILQRPVNSICGRITELCQAGHVIDSGKRRLNPMTRRNAIVWVVL